jgi:hypothetical protein
MDRIILIAQQLAKEGKTPNTALIKARLPKNVPLPAIIQGLQLWKDNPNKQIESPTELALTAATPKELGSFDLLIEQKIEAMIAPVLIEIEELKKQIDILQNNKKADLI